MRGLVAYEAAICDCGFHSTLTHDPANFFTIDDDKCPVCATAARWSRMQAAADDEDKKRAGDNPPPHRAQPDDGRRTFVRRMTEVEVQQRLARSKT